MGTNGTGRRNRSWPEALKRLRAGIFGKNSLVGAGSALDGRLGLIEAIVQAPGSGLTIDAEVLGNLVRESDTLRAALMRHELMSYALTQQIAACNARH